MKTLICKKGALGDVVRTTILLRELEGEIYWLSQKSAEPLLRSKKIKKRYFIDSEKDIDEVKKKNFDLVISLDEEEEMLDIVEKLSTDRLIGVYRDYRKQIDYTPKSAYWFDMSMVSKYGIKKANELKAKNKKTVPEILLNMIGKDFNGQEYDIAFESKDAKGRIGLIDVCTGLWPNKQWDYYSILKKNLREEGYKVSSLGLKPTLEEHIDDINNCEVVVCGDTLGMHIALALKKKVVALFNCTSPHEIEDYGRLEKVVSPLYEDFFYQKKLDPLATRAIPLEEVSSRVKKVLNR